MEDQCYRAIVLDKTPDNQQTQNDIKFIHHKELPQGEVLIKNMFSSLNYKDVLAFDPLSGVVRNYPIIPGIDFSGEVVKSKDPNFLPGEYVLGTGFGIGTKRDGGLSAYSQVPANWLVKLNDQSLLKYAMMLGTAGLTAGLSIQAVLKEGMQPDDAVLISGVTGGVGSIVLEILSKLGYQNISILVHSKDTRVATKTNLREVLTIEDLKTAKPLAHQKFDFVIDTVGGEVTESILPWIGYQGVMTVCGNVLGNELKINILPFILRGIRLIGIDSVNISVAERTNVWQKLFTNWNIKNSLDYEMIRLSSVESTVANWGSKKTSRIIVALV